MSELDRKDFRDSLRRIVERAGGVWTEDMDDEAEDLLEAVVTTVFEVMFASGLRGSAFREHLAEEVERYIGTHRHLH